VASVGPTVGRLLDEGAERLREAGSDTPRLDAELLLGHVLGLERTSVLAHPGAAAGAGHAERYRALVERRATGEPVAYIRGVKEFHGLAFAVDERALIPRPDTETLVDLAVAAVTERLVRAPRPTGTPPLRVWDVGTGSGAIGVSIAVALRSTGALDEVHILMSDLSAEALALALENVVAHALADRVDLARGDLLDVDPPPTLPVDILVANLPYIARGELAALGGSTRFEPPVALDGGDDGLEAIRRLLPGLVSVVAPAGVALLEIGADQEAAALTAASTTLGWPASVHPDLGGRPRVLRLDAPPPEAPVH
jgi:release factor glutamine methyltransferase